MIIDIFKQAPLPTGWADDVHISVDTDGAILPIEKDVPGATQGCLLPGMANLHSHAHQRAMAVNKQGLNTIQTFSRRYLAAIMALQQIKNKQYADKYRGLDQPVYLIGVEFSKENRNIVGFEVERGRYAL